MTTAEQVLILPVEGLESEHCALIVDKGLSKVEGLSSHKVELNNHRALITASEGSLALKKAIASIRESGYDVPTIKTSFPVLSMSCASCASSSQSMLENQTGVIDVAVNYANGNAVVEYVPTVTSPQSLKKSLQSIGYDLMIDESEDAREALDNLRHQNFVSLRQRTIAALLLSLPVVVIGMFFMTMPYANLIMGLLTTVVVFVFGRQFFGNAWKQARHGSANMDTLVALSTGVAYLFSLFNTFFPEYWHSRGLHAHVYFESAAVVITFILLGKWLEENAKGNTASALKKLMGMRPKTVTVVHDSGNQEVPITSVNVGTIILVKPGDKIAVDGIVVTGSSFVDESMISGEPVPVEKKEGMAVFAGTINQKGSFQFRAEKVGADTILSHTIKMVQQAQGSKPPVQRLVDKVAGIFVPVVIGIAVITLMVWTFFGGPNGFTQGLLAMVTVLVIACPCALGLATPTAIMAGVGKGAENGILIKDAQSLELAKNIQAIVLDKTGTITEGKPVVTDEFWLFESQEARKILATLEKLSEHPLAEAIVKHYNVGQFLPVNDFESITGLGTKAVVNNEMYFAGSKKLMTGNHIEINEALAARETMWLQQAKTVIWFANSKSTLAVIAIADKVKETSAQAIRQLQDSGIEVYMLTGDHETTAKVIAEQVGIRQYKAEVLPSDKGAFIKSLQEHNKVVAMVGDGINDSQALAQADVSVAMGKGSDIAMDVAKMTIISSDLTKIYKAIRLSEMTIRTIRQNLFWAFVYNMIGIPVAAGILYPFNGFLLNPMIAGAAMALSSVSVVTNSLRLKSRQLT